MIKMIVVIAIILNGANSYGYLRCKMGKQSIGSVASNFMGQQMLRNVRYLLVKNIMRKTK